ncbi:MAG: polysaccharide deacetylase family protein [Gammaproteobacteria bacterium]|nr:polysaccharide deacetylase family protein [Gammaproteobacteria bacterium]
MIDIILGRLLRLIIRVSLLIQGKNRLVVLTYHRVKQEDDPLQPDDMNVGQFERHIKALSAFYRVLKPEEAVTRLRKNTLPAGAVCITFDDGYANNYDIALPVLLKYRAPAIFFIAGSFINGGCMWNDIVIESIRRTKNTVLDLSVIGFDSFAIKTIEEKASAIEAILNQLKYRPMQQRLKNVKQLANIAGVTTPTDLMMSDEQIRNLHEHGMEIGGHTMNHPILTQISTEQARDEISTNKKQLESLVGEQITSFAYPNGKPDQDYKQEHIELLKECGYQSAFTTAWGSAKQNGDPYQIPRISSWDGSGLKLALRVLKTFFETPGRTL